MGVFADHECDKLSELGAGKKTKKKKKKRVLADLDTKDVFFLRKYRVGLVLCS